MWEEYKYIEAKYDFLDSTGNMQSSKWRRIQTTELRGWLDANPGKAAYFHTIQSFKLPVKEQDESHYADFYIDMDAEVFDDALRDARLIVDYFLKGHEVEPKVWFSGNRGFHITLDAVAFGAEPSSTLTYHWRHVADAIARKVGLSSLDERVYSRPRMWRIEKTRHAKSKLFKIRLYLHELRSLDAAGIKELAKTPRDTDEEVVDPPETACAGLATVYEAAVKEYSLRQQRYEDSEDIDYTFAENHPACIAYLLEHGLALLGTKNRADMALAGYCKTKGIPIDVAIGLMAAWSERIPVTMTHVSDMRQRVMQTKAVCRTVYADARYGFSCGSILACGVKVDCEKCFVKNGEPVELEIWEFSKAQNRGIRVSIEVDAIGKSREQLIYPSRIHGQCGGIANDSKVCQRCSMSRFVNLDTGNCERTILFNSANPMTLELLESQKFQVVRRRVRTLFGVDRNCMSFSFKAEWSNAQTIFIASRISTDFKLEPKTSRERVLYLGHGLELNRGYRMTGYVWSHPRNMAAILVADTATPLQSSLSALTFTKEELDELKIFQPDAGQEPLDKIRSIHKVFEDDFAFLFGRPELFMAVDLVYHSVRRVNFQRQLIRGWLDILILGDTGQGKSDICEKYMRYYDLGVMAAGETSSRTGLLYNIQMIAGEEAWIAFGLLPRANGHLVFVDEIHDMPSADFRQFTQVRSKGVVDVKRVAYGAAPAETRLVSIANAKRNRALGNYNYPVEAIPEIPCFAALEDVRRFDYAIGLKANDVDAEVINQDVREIAGVNNPYTGDLCKQLILWIWTRTPDHIIVTDECETVILKQAKRMAAEYVPDIPLVETADVRHKIVRVACAIAGRTYSTDDGENLIVKPEHAYAAYDVLYDFYRGPGLNYWGYSDDRAKGELNEDLIQEITLEFQAFDGYLKIARWVLNTVEFTRNRLQSSMNLPRNIAEKIMSFLVEYRMVKETGGKTVKTPSGRDFLYNLVPHMERAHLTAKQLADGVTEEDLKAESEPEEVEEF